MQTQFTFDTQVKTTLNIHATCLGILKLANVVETLSVRFENYHPTVYELHDSV